MNTPLVELAGASKTYGPVTALDAIDLRLEEGEVLGLLGHNGAGKTTLMKLILGLARPDSGAVRVFGEDAFGSRAERLRAKIGFLPESVSFYEQLSGREALRYFAALKRAPAGQADELLEQVGLNAVAGRRVKTWSKGMRQRLGLAQALLGEPRLLLLDEPTVGLDPLGVRDFYASLDELRGRGVSVILSSHVLAGVERHVDRVAILGRGRLLAAGALSELREKAGLPLLIRARTRLADAGRWGERLRDMPIATRRVNGARLELSVPVGAKLAALRILLDDPDLVDIEMEPPSLETLYAHFGEQSPSPEESR